MVIDGSNNQNTFKKKLLASNYGTFLLVKVMILITLNGPPTQLIDAQCALQILDNTIVAEEQSYRLMSLAGS